MIDYRPYRPRTHNFLLKKLRQTLNTMQMRDWQVELYYGDIPPTCLQSQSDKVGACKYWIYNLDAVIWVNWSGCKADNQDPLDVLLHEVAHIWLAYETNEERQANILALLIGNTIVKEKK